MNPFTESTVARPLSEPYRPAANDTAARGGPAPDAQTPSNNAASPPVPVKNAPTRRLRLAAPQGGAFCLGSGPAAKNAPTRRLRLAAPQGGAFCLGSGPAAKKRRMSRDPRSLRLARQRARNAARQARILRPVRRWVSAVSGRNQIGPPPSAQGRDSPGRFLAGAWVAYCRRAVTAAMGLGLALGLSAAWAVNVNSASAQQLETITGIGPKTAQIIIDERTRGGSFESFDDLAERVKGIGPKKAKSLQAAGLTVGQGAAAPNPPKPTPAVQRKAGK